MGRVVGLGPPPVVFATSQPSSGLRGIVDRVLTLSDCGTPTTMSGSRRIDTYQDDRGLTTCFAGANILEEWKSELVHAHKWETLEDFVYYFNESSMETSLDQVLQPTKMKDNRLLRARLKAAHAAGLEAIRAATAEAKQPEAVDETLPESTMQQLHKDFATKYGVVLDAFLEPSDALRSRIYREFRKRTMSVLSVAKVRSILHQSAPKQQESVRLGAGVQLEFAADDHRIVRTVVEYYFSLRTLAYAWAWGGLYKVSDFDGNEKVFMPLAPAMSYADQALQFTMEFGQGSLLWNEMTSTHAPRWLPSSAGVIPGRPHWRRHYARPILTGAPRESSQPCLRQVPPQSAA